MHGFWKIWLVHVKKSTLWYSTHPNLGFMKAEMKNLWITKMELEDLIVMKVGTWKLKNHKSCIRKLKNCESGTENWKIIKCENHKVWNRKCKNHGGWKLKYHKNSYSAISIDPTYWPDFHLWAWWLSRHSIPRRQSIYVGKLLT